MADKLLVSFKLLSKMFTLFKNVLKYIRIIASNE